MIRRQIFFGITLILLAILIFLILRGRTSEKEREAQNIKIEEVASGPLSPVRALQPRDLKIIEAKISWTRNPDEKDDSTARHDISVRNIGGGNYAGLRLRMEYLDGNGEPVEVRTYVADEPLPPEGTLRMPDIVIDGLPDAASGFRATVLSADLESVP